MIGVHTKVRPSDWFIAVVCLIVNHLCLSHTEAVELAWDSSPSADVAGYYLYYGDINGTITNRIVLGNTTSTTFTDMYAGVTYFFYVTAYNQSAQESEPSNTITYSTDPGVNSAPVLAAIPNQTVNEGTKLTLTASATDSDTPANLLTYSLDPGAPAGMTINSSTGVLTWTPTESQGPNVSTITVRVTDNGVPPLSDTKSFSVRVNEVNSAPVLAVIANQTVNKGSTLTLTATATDSDLPANTLTYSLDSGALAGMAINSATGALTWTPTQAQGPSTNTITVHVTDNGSPPMTGTKTFTVVVNGSNSQPVLSVIANQTISEGSTLSLTLTATDSDLPANLMTYSLVSGPTGASVNASSGVFFWTPTEAQGPSTNNITVRVTDNGSPPLSDTKSFTVVVMEVNKPPVLAAITNQTVNKGATLSLTVAATDPDLPANVLTYSLASGPAGASVNASSGLFSWTPTAAQGPSTNNITVRVTDNGSPPLSDTESFIVVVMEVNKPPVLVAIANQTVSEGATLSFTVAATDPDLPANVMTYSLVSGPTGAGVNASSGVFSWTPTEAQGPSTNNITVRVTDNGSPPLSDTNRFTVVVMELNRPPVLAATANQMVNQGATLSLAVAATDLDLPANAITYTLVNGPTGAILNATNGAFIWTPLKSQGPSTNSVTVLATDNGSPSLSDTETFSIVVTESNAPPMLATLADHTINEGVTLSFGVPATNAAVPANTLTYSLYSATAAGASIHPSTGLFTWTPSEAQGPSTNTITVGVTDNGSPPLSDTKSFRVVVKEVNSAPVLSPIANRVVNEGGTLTLTATATDADLPTNTLSFSLVSPPSGASISTGSGVFTWTPSESQAPGAYAIQVRVTDNGVPSMSATQSFMVAVLEVNTAPALAAIPDRTINKGTTLTLIASATDADLPANTLTYSLDPGAPAGASIDASSGVFTWTPNEAQAPSTNIVTVRVTDSGVPSLSATRSFTVVVVVNEVNSPPVLADIANQTITEGALLTFTNSTTGAAAPAITLIYSLDPDGPSGASVDPATGVFTWTPDEAQGPGTYKLTLRVTDNRTPSLSSAKSFRVTVNETNTAPVVAALPNATVTEGSTWTLTARASDADVPANTLTFSLVAPPIGASIDSNTGVLTWTPNEAQGPGIYTLRVRATDNGTPPLSHTRTFTVIVNDGNSPPVLADIANQTVTEGALLTFTNSTTGAATPAITLTYSLDPDAPTGASVDPATGVFTWTPDEAQGPGTYKLTLRVTDNRTPSLSSAKSFRVTVSETNTAPVVAALPNATVTEGSTLTLTARASDADVPANTLTFSLVAPPIGASIDPNTGVLTWTPNEAQGPSIYTLRVRATDNGTPPLSHTRTFTVIVNDGDNPPVLADIANQTVTEGALLTFTNSTTGAAAPAITLTYSLDPDAPSGASVDPATGVFTWTPDEAQGPGTYELTLRVTDNRTPSLSSAKSFRVTVNETNTAPVVAALPNAIVTEGTTLTLTARASDADVPANTLTFSLVAPPIGASIDPNTGVLTWTPNEAQGPSTNTLTVRITDDGTPPLSNTRTFTVIVGEVNSPPVLADIANQTITEGTRLIFTNGATDADVPANILTYSLDPGAPAGASIDARTGLFTWTPNETQAPSTNLITVRVTDSGLPRLSATRSLTVVVVKKANSPPALAPIASQAVTEGNMLTLTLSATDPDGPSNTSTFSLVSAPPGANLNPGSGVFTWTPTEAQGPSTNTLTVRVTDNGDPPLSDTRTFTVTVNEVNSPPVLAAIANQTVTEGSTLTLTAKASDADVPANTLTFSLVAPPIGATIDPNTGVLTWTPNKAQGPATYTLRVRAIDNGTPPLSDTKTFTVTVNETNTAPVVAALSFATVTEGSTLTLTARASDADVPSNSLIFSLVGPPIGATINPNTGVLTWTPNEAQGPATYTLRVRATDNGTPPLNDTKAFTVIVNEVNTPPVLGPLADQTVMQGSILTFTAQATDADLPAQRLTYTLDARAPVGATINPTNGVFTWTPATNHAPSTNTVTIRVTDNGAPSLNDTKTVTIIVNEQSGLRMLGLTSPIQGYVSLAWTAEAGRSYRVQWKASITDAIWSDLGEVTASDDIGYFTHAVGLAPQGFYRVQLVR